MTFISKKLIGMGTTTFFEFSKSAQKLVWITTATNTMSTAETSER